MAAEAKNDILDTQLQVVEGKKLTTEEFNKVAALNVELAKHTATDKRENQDVIAEIAQKNSLVDEAWKTLRKITEKEQTEKEEVSTGPDAGIKAEAVDTKTQEKKLKFVDDPKKRPGGIFGGPVKQEKDNI